MQATENIGMVMIFTLVTAAQEKVVEVIESLEQRKEEEKKRKEAEMKKIEEVVLMIKTYHFFLNC